jgi:hypothetical protein
MSTNITDPLCTSESSRISLLIAGLLLIISEVLGLIRSSPYRGILQILVDAFVQLSNLTQPPEEQPSIKDRQSRHVNTLTKSTGSLSSDASARSRINSAYFLETGVSDKITPPPIALVTSPTISTHHNGQPGHTRLSTL